MSAPPKGLTAEGGAAGARAAGAPRRTVACLALLALLPFALFWKVTLLQRVFAEGDLFSYNYPLLHTIAEQWKSAELPLWNPYIFGGTPLHANMQGGAFYPPNALCLVLPAWVAYQWGILLHYSMAGVFMFLYIRALDLARSAAVLGAVVFVLGGFPMGTLGHVSTLRTYPWLPLVLLGLEMWSRTFDRRYAALAAAAAGFMLLAGHPQVPLYALTVASAYAGWLAVSVHRGRDRARVAVGSALALLLGAGIGAVQLLPTLQLAAQEYLRPMHRSYDYFVNFSLCPLLLVNLVFPRLIPTDESELAVYVGASTLVFALVALLRPPLTGRGQRAFFGFVAALSLVLAFGRWTVLSPLLFRVPLYNLFTAPGRNLFEFDFAVAVLAALGLHSALQATTPRVILRKGALVSASIAGLALALLALARWTMPLADTGFVRLGEVAFDGGEVWDRLPLLLASLGLVAFFPRSGRWQRRATFGVVALLVVDLFSYASSIYRIEPPAVYTRVPPVVAFLKSTAGPTRILTLPLLEGDRELDVAMLTPNSNAVHGIESINGFDSMMLRQIDLASGHVMPTYGLIAGPGTYDEPQFQRFMDLLNARYVLTPVATTLDLPPPRYRAVYADDRVRVLENTQALPRFFLVPAATAVTSQQALDVLASGRLDGVRFDPRDLALVEAPADAVATHPVAAVAAEPVPERGRGVEVAERSPGFVRLRIETARDGVLVHSANYSEGWRAFVDGAPAPLWRVDGLVQGVRVSAGRHEVRLEYLPKAFVLGAAISLLSGLTAGAAWIRRRAPEPLTTSS